ncbi:hypothetical protein HPP92_017678 [Vanilla planifolia]|uniref:Uncharacterized protein n=1 Tax=Vanilla planifolia TaxID=51239 RepID=A0A835Q8E1_VANPL|nr:hypothetical protein HPP92_017678 [Vanilla planifolia]
MAPKQRIASGVVKHPPSPSFHVPKALFYSTHEKCIFDLTLNICPQRRIMVLLCCVEENRRQEWPICRMNSVEGFAECLEIKTLIPNGEWNEDGHTIVPDLQMVKQL